MLVAAAAAAAQATQEPLPPGSSPTHTPTPRYQTENKGRPTILHMTPAQKRKYKAFFERMEKRELQVPSNATYAVRRKAANWGPDEDAFMRRTLTKRQYRSYRAEARKRRRLVEHNIRLLKTYKIKRI